MYAQDEAALLVAAAGSPQELEDLLARRVAGVPLEVVVGFADFAGIRVLLSPGVFVPRQRTALLVDLAVGIVRHEKHHLRSETGAFRGGLSRNPVVVDLCCGSGAVGAALAHRLPEAEVWAADVDPVCVACAKRNLPPGRVLEGDLYAALPVALRGRVDVLVANAPYVPTEAISTMPTEARDHEPRVALDGGDDGADLHRRIIAGAAEWLAPGGHLLIETGRVQSALTLAACAAAGLVARVETDDERDATAVAATSSVGLSGE